MSRILFLFVVVLCCSRFSHGQPVQQPVFHHCRTSEAAATFYEQHREFKSEQQAFEEFTKSFPAPASAAGVCYVIPVVFHVYGTTQGGYPVNLSIIQGALNMANDDFHGLNSDYNSVHTQFMGIRAAMPDIIFALAQIDPSGNATTGIINHPVAAGFGNGSGYDSLIQADAWDNYKYMNIYVMNDLYDDGVTNNSGIAWYPNSWMSNNNLARIVYNGAYLGVNCNSWQPEFASTLTHEFGHWLNLIHTFDGGCTGNNDNVSDTPPCDYFLDNYGCHPSSTASTPISCGNLVNAENYMDYSGTSGCYRMFTQGQATRMYAALQHPARITLWQTSNLQATGLTNLCIGTGIAAAPASQINVTVFPNPSAGQFTLHLNGSMKKLLRLEVTDMLGRRIFEKQITGEITFIDLSAQPPGIYVLRLSGEMENRAIRLVRE
ncbi:MAG: hypothetical protein FD123_842 [Bacteroidetes bacterium]|nr:MAG: hypothetical protein FD123_842 [Bacteroidota bacterium]